MGTEHIVLAPGAYWRTDLRWKIERLVDRKYEPEDRPEADDTIVVASISKRAERDLTKQYYGLSIEQSDWLAIEDRINAWEGLFRAGEHITLKITCKFKPRGKSSQSGSGRVGKRGRTTATQRMLVCEAAQRDAEIHSAGEEDKWRGVYALVYCTCERGPHCWKDPVGKKHYRLLTHHLKKMVKYVQAGNKLDSHDDMPDEIRRELFAEDRLRADQRRKLHASPQPVHITNVLPSQGATAEPVSLNVSDNTPSTRRLRIPGPRDVAMESYVRWQQSKDLDKRWAKQYARAGEIFTNLGYSLGQICRLEKRDMLTEHDIAPGIADHFVEDIPEWLEQYECADEI